MAVTAYKCDPRALFGEQSWTIVPSGTAIEALTKATEQPAAPATEPRLTSATNAQKGFFLFGAPSALKTALEAGGVVVEATLWLRVENRAAAGKNLKFGFVEPALGTAASEPELAKTVGTWVSVAVSKAEAEANLNTVTKIQAQRALLEHLTIKELWAIEFYLEIDVEEATAKKVAASTSTSATVSATVRRLAASPASTSSGASTTAALARLATASARVSSGALVSVGALVKTERGPQAAKVSGGAATAATVARRATAAAVASAGATVRAEALRRAQSAAQVSGGASVAASVRRVAQAIPRVSGGAVVGATVRRVAKVSAIVSSSASTRATVSARVPLRATVSSGAIVSANVVRVGQAEEPPTSTPIAGHVAIGQRGRIGVHRGRLPTGNIGRAER